LPDYLLGFERLYARVIIATLELVKYRAIELLKDKEYPVVFSEHLK